MTYLIQLPKIQKQSNVVYLIICEKLGTVISPILIIYILVKVGKGTRTEIAEIHIGYIEVVVLVIYMYAVVVKKGGFTIM